MVESVAKEMPKSIATQGISGKKSNTKNAFADFIKELGKTTTKESTNPNFIKTSTLGESSAIQKNEILSNILKGKSEEKQEEKPQQSPLEAILQRPKTTQSKLNLTPEIKQPKDSIKDNEHFTNRDATIRNLGNIKFDSSPNIVKTAESNNESKNIPTAEDLQKIGQNALKNANIADSATHLTPKEAMIKQKLESMPKESPKNATQSPQIPLNNLATNKSDSKDLATKSQPLESSQESQELAQKLPQESPQDLAQTSLESPIKTQPQEIESTQKNAILNSTQKTADETSINPKEAQTLPNKNEILNNIESNETPNITQLQQNAVQNTQKLKESTKESPKNLTQNPPNSQISQSNAKDLDTKTQDLTQDLTQNATQNTPKFANLGIANTLKYGAFKAFDALSLLKPSDGKKISDLIKKADELSLNLKYAKMAMSGNNFTSQTPPQTPKITPQPPNAMQDLQNAKDANVEQVLQNATPKIIDSKDSNKDNIKAETPKNSNEIKNEKNTNNESKEQNAPKLAESKVVESKIEEPKMPQEKAEKITQEKMPEKTQNIEKAVQEKISPEKIAQEKTAQNVEKSQDKNIEIKAEKSPQSSDSKPSNDLKPASFKVGVNNEAKAQNAESNAIQNTIQNESPQNNIANTEPKIEQLGNKLFDARETMRHFAHNLRAEIQNYKPPLSRITLELQPASLGSVEVSIISQGKNIQIQLNANQSTLNLFIQNQSDLRQALAQIGYDNVAMSFSNGSQMGFSDSNGKWRYESQKFNKLGNNFGLNNNEETNDIFEIMITNNYA